MNSFRHQVLTDNKQPVCSEPLDNVKNTIYLTYPSKLEKCGNVNFKKSVFQLPKGVAEMYNTRTRVEAFFT